MSFVAGALGIAGVYAGSVLLLATLMPDHLPPPSISNRISFDEKLRFIRQHTPLDPPTLAVGSSLTLRQLDGAAFDQGDDPVARVFNGSSWGLQINQTHYLIDFYLSQFPRTRRVISLIGPADFRDCQGQETDFFNTTDARAYAFEGRPILGFYFRYFNPLGLAKEVWRIAEDRQPGMDARLWLDPYGSQPLDAPPGVILNHYTPEPLDPSCFAAFDALVDDLSHRLLDVYLVLAPISPAFFKEFPEARAYVDRFRTRLAASVAGTPVRLIDVHAAPEFGPEDFVDAYHLRWTAAQRLSRRLAALLTPASTAALPDAVKAQ